MPGFQNSAPYTKIINALIFLKEIYDNSNSYSVYNKDLKSLCSNIKIKCT